MPAQPFLPASFETFGDLLKFLRRRERLTQLDLSIMVGYSEAQIGRLEKNQRRPDLAAVKALFVPALHIEEEPQVVARMLELAQSARQTDAPAPGIPPYKGLIFFDESDSDLFFGRETLTSHLADRVADLAMDASSRFLAVVGASGSGKSSLVRAGLAATLQRNGWETRILTPTENPLRMLNLIMEAPAYGKADHILLLVDQFEETFTLCRDELERVAFIEKILSIAKEPEDRTVIVIALRADFYSHCAQYPFLRSAVAAEQEYIGQMTTSELRRAIEEPAKRGGWEFESGLADLLLNDIGVHGTGEPEPGALPLLSHALLATWERRRGKTFTIEGYRASGGVRGAIAETAESVFADQLNQAQQELARDVFLRLTELGEGTEDTRRRASLNELAHQSEEAAQLRAVLNTLAEARLITLNEDSAEVAHEALIREWQRLHEWLTQDREGLRLQRHLTESAREWELRGRDASELYRGARLAQAREWVAANPGRLNASEYAFLESSIELEQHDAREREARRQRELESVRQLAEMQKQAAGRLRRVSVFLLVSLVVMFLLAGFTYRLNRLATSRELASASVNNLDVDPERSILLALEALSVSKTSEAEDVLHRAVMASRVMQRIETDHEIYAIAYSPDGSRLVTAGRNGIATVRDAFDGKSLLVLKGHNASIGSVAFSPDGRRIATASDDTTVCTWDAETGKLLSVLDGHTARVSALAFSPDGMRLATVSEDKTLRLWNANDGSVIFTGPERANDRVKMISVAFAPNGKQLATGSVDSVIEIWDSHSNEPVTALFNPDLLPISSLAFSPDGKYLASASGRSVRLWDLQSGQIVMTLNGHTNNVFSIAFSPDGSQIATAGLDRKIHIWDLSAGQILFTLAGHQGAVNSVAFNPARTQLASAGDDADIRLWDVGPGREVYAIDTPNAWGRVALSGDGKYMAESVGSSVKVWEVETGEERYTLPQTVSPNGVALDPSGRRLATTDENGMVKIWDLETQKVQFTLKGHTGPTSAVAFSPDGTKLASGGEDSVIKLWDANSGELLLDMKGHAYPVTSLMFSPDGETLASAGVDNKAILWDVNTGEPLRILQGHTDVVWGVIFSLDGNRIVTASRDATIKVWDVETGTVLLTLTGHTSTVVTAVFSPDGQQIASSSMDGTTKLWEASSGKLLLSFYGTGSGVGGVGFTPDGSRLITASAEALRVYLLRLDDLIELAKSRLTRMLTTEECREFLHVETCPTGQ